ncbi:hypothetical protein [Gilliamella sp. Gris1-4]|uniref:hypothetical protein n=1 Tax=Gilliamella sp. Gris1-4 TaxID=3120244 RepID=UPI0009BD9DCD|nr:hypothetical protein [Gilliamella apicola]
MDYLGKFKDTENSVFDYNSPDDQVSGITTAVNLKTWFEKAGAKSLYEINTSLMKHIIGTHLTLQDLCRLNSYIAPNTHVVVLVAAQMIEYGNGKTKNHWIVWTDKLKLFNGQEITEQTALTEQVQLELYSWGKVKNQLAHGRTLGEVMQYSFAAMVVSKIP